MTDYSESQALVPDNADNRYKNLMLKHLRPVSTLFIFFCTLLSPVMMILLPKMGFIRLKHSQLKCGVGCEGLQVAFAFKLVILAVGSWAVFYRKKPATLPRVQTSRIVIGVALSVLIISSCVVYIQNYMEGSITYDSVLVYASGYLNTLLWFHYLLLTVTMVLPCPYVLHVLRSPDGAIGRVSVQEAASLALSSLYTQFPAQRRGTRGHKRRAELISGTEEAFTRLRRVPYGCPASEAARALFPHIIQPLQKYLKTTCRLDCFHIFLHKNYSSSMKPSLS